MSRTFPLPGAVAPGPWEILEGPPCPAPGLPAGAVNKVRRRVLVPLGPDIHERALRAHELAHIAYSPRRPGRHKAVDQDVLLAVEDARVNLRAEEAGAAGIRAGYPAAWEEAQRAQVRDLPEPRRTREAVLMAISRAGTDGLAPWLATLEGIDPEGTLSALVGEAITRITRGGRPPWRRTVKVARWLTSILPRPPAPPRRGRYVPDPAGGPQWGDMSLEVPPLPLAAPGYARTRPRLSDEGSILRAPWRLPIDGRIFVSPPRRRPRDLALLVDCSGSMHWDPDDLRDVLAAVPGALVALYSGDRESSTGILRIVARGGRRAEDGAIEAPSNCHNIVDGPALRWLASQRAARKVWLSDGYVTGRGESTNPGLSLEVGITCRAAGIARVEDRDALADALK